MAKRRPQGDGTIRKRSDGRWEARIIIGHKNDGSPMYKSAFAKTQKPGTGCVYQINDSLWEGSFYPRLADGNRKKFNVYAKTREECEEALAKMIAEKKAEIAAEKAKMKTA